MTDEFKLIQTPRSTVELTLDDGRIIVGKRGARLEEFAKVIQTMTMP